MVGVVLSAGGHIGRQPVDVILVLAGICRLQIGQFTVQKKNISILSKTAAGILSPVILTGICFLLLFLTCGQILPHARGRSLPFQQADVTFWMGRKLHLIRQLQENTVCPVPTLPDAGDEARAFQFGQRGLDRPLAPVHVVRHLPDGVDHIDIPILRHPAGFLGELCASQQQGIEQFGIDRVFSPKDKPRQRYERRQRGVGFVVDGTSLPFSGTRRLRRTVGSFGVVMWADDHHSAEALLAVVNAPAAKGVIGDAPPVIQEERPFFLSLFAHTRHNGLLWL